MEMNDTSASARGCPDEERLEAYARGELPSSEAEAVEEHFLGCEACWRRVRQGLEIRAALQGEADAPPGAREPAAASRSRRWRPALAAAALLVVALGGAWLWQVGPGRHGGPPLRSTGERPALEISLTSSGDGLDLAWERVPGARVYRLEGVDEEGTVVLVRETESVALELSSREPAPVEVRVLALDALRQELAASPWREVGAGGSESGGAD